MKVPGKTKRPSFPTYLKPGPNRDVLRWLGNQLKQLRGERTVQAVSTSAQVKPKEVIALERGDFRINLGRLRDVVSRGYKSSFEELLSKCYDAHPKVFNPGEDRYFKRESHYSLCLKKKSRDEKEPTPLLIGGDPKSYLWAIPMRCLNGQPMVTEFLELAPFRKREIAGVTPNNSHDGVEIVHVIHGTIDACILYGDGGGSRRLKAGDSIHFLARTRHQIENQEKSSSALLLVIRLPKL